MKNVVAMVNGAVFFGMCQDAFRSVSISYPKLWGAPPTQTANRYVAVTTVSAQGKPADVYETLLSFVTVRVTDKNGLMVPNAKNALRLSIEGAREIVATDNGDAANLVPFPLHERDAFNGLCFIIVRAKPGQEGTIKLKAEAAGLEAGTVALKSVDGR